MKTLLEYLAVGFLALVIGCQGLARCECETITDARTAVVATTLTKPATLQALQNRNAYATLDRNLRINATVEGSPSGSILAQNLLTDQEPSIDIEIDIEINDVVEPTQEKTEETKKTVTQQLLDLLYDSEQINDQKYKDLMQQAEEEAALFNVEDDPSAWKFRWDDTFKLDRNDGAFKLRFGGRIQLDTAAIGESSAIEESIGERGFGTEFRRARLYFSGTAYEQLFFKVQYDFAGDEPTRFKDVYLGLMKLPKVGNVRVGHYKEPFSLEQLTSGNDTTFMERSLPDVFAPGRNTGAMISNTAMEQRVTWAVGAFFRTDDFGDTFSNSANYDVTARLTGLSWYEEDGRKLLHLGGAYSHQFVDGLRYRQRPEAHMAPRFVDTGAIPTEDVDLLNVEAAWIHGPLSIQSEFTGSLIDQSGMSDAFLWGTYVEVSYFLTGEHRPYDRKKATFVRVKPNKNFSVSKGDWGAFELTGRYSYVNLDDSNINGGALSDVSGGLNWYLFPNSRVMLNYVYSHLNGVGDANIAEIRFQVTF